MNHWFIVGTAAELIKLYPLINESEKRGIGWRILQTGQSSQNFLNQAEDFGIPNSHIIEVISNKDDLKNSFKALIWFIRALFVRLAYIHRRVAESNSPLLNREDILFVHGDTLSTVIGSIYGRRLGMTIVHIEAGMRSHCWRSPFPEEVSRRFVSRLATIHMAPDENASSNLLAEGIKKNVFVTGGNTVVDALKLALRNTKTTNQPYVLANIHRFENLHSSTHWNQIVDLLIDVSKDHKIILILMPNTIEFLNKDKKSSDRLLEAGIYMQNRLPFRQFAELLHGATFVLSDGGSNQQECHYIGKPCLVLRDVTESLEGLGGSCVLAKFDDEVIKNFITEYQRYVRPSAFPSKRPTDIIFERLNL